MVSGRVREVFVSGDVQAVFISGQLGSGRIQAAFVSGRIRAVFFSIQFGSRHVRAVFMSGQEFVFGRVQTGVCLWIGVCLRMRPDVSLSFGCIRAVFVARQLGSGCVRRVLSPDVSERCLFLASLVPDASGGVCLWTCPGGVCLRAVYIV